MTDSPHYLTFTESDETRLEAALTHAQKGGWFDLGGGCTLGGLAQFVTMLMESDERRTMPGAPDSIEALIERSSLGSPDAKAARESAEPVLVERVMERVRREMSGETFHPPVTTPCPMCHGSGQVR